MDVARELVGSHATGPGWSGLVVANQQLAGRGRQGRPWHSTGGALLATYVLCVEGGPAKLSGYSLACGVGLRRAMLGLGARVQVKWPNDLVSSVGGRLKKVGGILIELEPFREFHCVLVGVGINIGSVPADLADIATSVTDLRGSEVSVEQVLQHVSQEVLETHRRFVSTGGFSAFLEEWSQASCFRPGVTSIGIDTGAGETRGTYQGVDATGALVLRVNGENRSFVSGHITSIAAD